MKIVLSEIKKSSSQLFSNCYSFFIMTTSIAHSLQSLSSHLSCCSYQWEPSGGWTPCQLWPPLALQLLADANQPTWGHKVAFPLSQQSARSLTVLSRKEKNGSRIEIKWGGKWWMAAGRQAEGPLGLPAGPHGGASGQAPHRATQPRVSTLGRSWEKCWGGSNVGRWGEVVKI